MAKKKAAQAAPCPAALQPQGTSKRAHAAVCVRPSSFEDPAAGNNIYEPEKVASQGDKWPNLAKMVKQYFAAPASSAGVQRVFSAAGKMHGDLMKRTKDDTLEASLFAAFNCD